MLHLDPLGGEEAEFHGDGVDATIGHGQGNGLADDDAVRGAGGRSGEQEQAERNQVVQQAATCSVRAG